MNIPLARVADPLLQADLGEAARIAARHAALQRQPAARRRQRLAAAALLAELLANIAVTYALVYAPLPWWLKAILLAPWSIYSALSLDNVIHYLNHWPLGRRDWINLLVRALHVPLLLTPLEIHYHHWQHHKNIASEGDVADDIRALAWRGALPGLAMARFAIAYVARGFRDGAPWAPLPDYIVALRATRPAHYAEIRAVRWAGLFWLVGLLLLDPRDTFIFFVPAVVIMPPFASLLMNLTDHIPSVLSHPFRQATHFEPRTRAERFLSALNRHTAATHLTHHLFPHVHWAHLAPLQRDLGPIYARHQAPRSLILNTALIGNWFAFLRVWRQVERLCLE